MYIHDNLRRRGKPLNGVPVLHMNYPFKSNSFLITGLSGLVLQQLFRQRFAFAFCCFSASCSNQIKVCMCFSFFERKRIKAYARIKPSFEFNETLFPLPDHLISKMITYLLYRPKRTTPASNRRSYATLSFYAYCRIICATYWTTHKQFKPGGSKRGSTAPCQHVKNQHNPSK